MLVLKILLAIHSVGVCIAGSLMGLDALFGEGFRAELTFHRFSISPIGRSQIRRHILKNRGGEILLRAQQKGKISLTFSLTCTYRTFELYAYLFLSEKVRERRFSLIYIRKVNFFFF